MTSNYDKEAPYVFRKVKNRRKPLQNQRAETDPAGIAGPIRDREDTYLKRLRIPFLYAYNGRHFTQALREIIELLDTMCQPNGQLLYRHETS
jgi:hypothetical protein